MKAEDRIKLLAAITGLVEWRFVPHGWESPAKHHEWCVVTDPDLVEQWKSRLVGQVSTWWLYPPGKSVGLYPYRAEISFDSESRPVLVCVGGIA